MCDQAAAKTFPLYEAFLRFCALLWAPLRLSSMTPAQRLPCPEELY